MKCNNEKANKGCFGKAMILKPLHKAKVEASTCPICSGLCLEKCVLCDHCFIWFHNKCAKVSQENIADVWKCSKCLKCKDCQSKIYLFSLTNYLY